MAKAKKKTRGVPTLRDEIAASGETPAAERGELDGDNDFLAREFLTWLVFHADAGGGAFEGNKSVPAFSIQFGGRMTLRTHLGLVTDMTVKGSSPAISPDLRYALAGGLGVKEADLRLVVGEAASSSDDLERAYTFGLAAEHFDLKRVKLPALLTEEDDDRADERLTLLADLDAALRLAFGHFVELRTRPSWSRAVVPALRKWLAEST